MKNALNAVLKAAFALLICTFCLCLCSCSEKAEEKPVNSGVPDRVVTRQQQSDSEPESTPVSEPGISSDEPDVQGTDISDSNSSQTADAAGESTYKAEDEPEAVTSEDENVTVPEDEGSAAEYLRLLNSSKVHAILVEASSHDNENASSIEREYFVNGSNAVFINGSIKIIMDDDEVTVIDLDEMTYYSYPREDEDTGVNFGYDISDYTLISRNEDEDGTLTEVYEIARPGGNIKSTWTFFPGGRLTVADITQAGTYYWYSFSLIESDVSGMDMSIPEGVIETEPEDYFG